MSISSSLFSGISGLSSMGNAMSVIGDNIANVNTSAFKSARATFQDVLSQQISTAAGASQVGRGVTLSSISGMFAQGSFESSSQPTDLAIGGNGFFIVRAPGTESLYYTRAGEFRFDQTGYLVSPSGSVVQGWSMDADTGQVTGTLRDVMVPKSSAPVATSTIQVITTLDSRKAANGGSLYDPVAAAGDWDGTADPPIGSTKYEYHSAIKTYDSLGNSHDLTIYFDPCPTAAQPNLWEYLVTCAPAEDIRTGASGKAWAGALLYGNMDFSNSGNIVDLTANGINPATGALAAKTVGVDTPNGYFSCTANYTGTDQDVALNFGSNYNATSTNWQTEALSSTQYASSSTTIFADQNGFGPGFLQSVAVNCEGKITGHYSNGQVLQRALIGLADFSNLTGLSKMGGNLYAETTDSGAPVTGQPGNNGLGTIAPNSLEQSNVDLGAEFVRMITIQRGFQANSKIITTTDDMLAELINLKR